MISVRVEEWQPYKWSMVGELAITTPILLFFFARSAGGTLRRFPAPLGHIFLAGLAASAMIAAYGIIRGHTVRGVLWERAGQLGIAILLVTYGTWAIGLFGAAGTQFAGLILSRALAATLRVIQIGLIRRKERGIWPYRSGRRGSESAGVS